MQHWRKPSTQGAETPQRPEARRRRAAAPCHAVCQNQSSCLSPQGTLGGMPMAVCGEGRQASRPIRISQLNASRRLDP